MLMKHRRPSYLRVEVWQHERTKANKENFFALGWGTVSTSHMGWELCMVDLKIDGCEPAKHTCVHSTGSKCNARCM